MPQRHPQDNDPPEYRDRVVIAALTPSDTERVEQFAIGQRGEKILDRLERRTVFEAVPGEQRLGRVDDHHGRLTRGLRDDISAHTDNYATYPRDVGGMVEKSRKNPFCDAKSANIGFLGERLSKPKRATSIIKDLRAAQATRRSQRSVGR